MLNGTRSQTLHPGKTSLERIDCDIRISLVALDDQLASTSERTSIKLTQHDPEDPENTTTFVLANLVPGKASKSPPRLVDEIYRGNDSNYWLHLFTCDPT